VIPVVVIGLVIGFIGAVMASAAASSWCR